LKIGIPTRGYDNYYSGTDEVIATAVQYNYTFDTLDGLVIASNILRAEALKQRQTLEIYYGQAERLDIGLQGLRNSNIAFNRALSGTDVGRVFDARQQAIELQAYENNLADSRQANFDFKKGQLDINVDKAQEQIALAMSVELR